MAEEEEENIFSFRDKTPAPDPTHEYNDTVRDAHTPIIIDNGNKFLRLPDYSKCFSTFPMIEFNTDTFVFIRRIQMSCWLGK